MYFFCCSPYLFSYNVCYRTSCQFIRSPKHPFSYSNFFCLHPEKSFEAVQHTKAKAGRNNLRNGYRRGWKSAHTDMEQPFCRVTGLRNITSWRLYCTEGSKLPRTPCEWYKCGPFSTPLNTDPSPLPAYSIDSLALNSLTPPHVLGEVWYRQ